MAPPVLLWRVTWVGAAWFISVVKPVNTPSRSVVLRGTTVAWPLMPRMPAMRSPLG